MVPADQADQNAHRAELSGVSGMITTLEMICEVHDITSGHIELGLDGENALNKIRDTHHPHPSQPDYARRDYLIQYGETFGGDVEVFEYFAEAQIPFTETFDVQLAARNSEYESRQIVPVFILSLPCCDVQ